MRKLWSVIILVVVLGISLGAYVYVDKHPKNTANNNTGSTSSDSIELLKLDKTKIAKINLTNEKGGLSLEQKSGKWVISSNNDIKLDDTFVTNVESDFTGLYATKLVEDNATNLDQYGLKAPKTTGTATLSDGSSKTIYLGNQTVDGTSYYLMVKDSPKVYVISGDSAIALQYGVSDIRSRALTAITVEDVKELKIVNSNGRTIEIKANTGQSDQEKQNSINSFIMTSPYAEARGVDDTKLNTFLTSISTLKIKDFVDDAPKDLAKYGLDKPSIDFSVKDSKNELHLYFGKTLENGDIAFKVAGSPQVYSIDKTSVDTIFNASAFDLNIKLAYIPNIDTVDGVTIEHNGKKEVISLSRTTKKAEKAGDPDETVTTYKLNDKEVEEDTFKKFYQTLIGIPLEAENDKSLSENAEVKIVYTLNKGTNKTATVSYVTYNNDYDAVFVNGKSEFLVAKLKVQDMLNQLADLQK